MKKLHITHIIAGLILGTTLSLTSMATAADAPKKEAKAAAEAAHPTEGRKLPFHGKLGGVNKAEKTITISYSTGDKVFHVTGETQIFKLEKPATLADAVIGEEVSGSYVKHGDRLDLHKLNLAKKHDASAEGATKAAKKEAKAAKDAVKDSAK